MDLQALFAQYKAPELLGRYITLESVNSLIDRFSSTAEIITIGHSVLGKPIRCCKVGNGKTKMLLWSQMHGNESTTTKAVFDFTNMLSDNSPLSKKLLSNFTFYIIPMLNPDGAERYTRENANDIDLNRDFCNLTQPESIALFQLFKEINPNYCYNLHDQRTIYGVGDSGKPATISFLAPSYNEAREINESRGKAISVIAAMNDTLQKFIPGQVGRFDDSFNINCAGDTFQFNNTPTILFEAGHYPNDYDREMTRKYVFMALVTGLSYIYENVIVNNRIKEYLNIPQNRLNFNDFVYKNVKINYGGIEKITNFAAQYREVLVDDRIMFEAYIEEIGQIGLYFGHVEIDAENQLYTDGIYNKPELEQRADFYLGKTKVVNGVKI